MAVLAFITPECQEEAARHGIIDAVERQRIAVESSQSPLVGFDPFPPPYSVKKQCGGRRGRLVALQRTVGEHVVVVFLAVFIRADRDYAKGFSSDPVGYGERFLLPRIDEAFLRGWVDERTKNGTVPAKQALSEVERLWLYESFAHRRNDTVDDLMVYESSAWVERVGEERVSKFLAMLAGPVSNALGLAPGLHWNDVPTKTGWGFWALRKEQQFVLLALSTGGGRGETEATAAAMARTIAAEPDALARTSRRAYPALVLALDDLWIDLEKETTANLALSPEESEVLAGARHTTQPFPLFINGRAGSGKSTILQYLFADLLLAHLRPEFAGKIAPPLYLTANGALLRVARSFVGRLLRQGGDFVAAGAGAGVDADESRRDDLLQSSFQEFQPYLLSLLPEEDRNRFAPQRRVDYARFRRMWEQRFGRDPVASSTFGPDVCWHVIRSLIKGMGSEVYFDADDYSQLSRNMLTVSEQTFQTVYERVFDNWYEDALKEQGLWDDQDLVRHVLERELVKPIWAGVLCDEAQDFTRIEMEVLLRLNLYSARSFDDPDLVRRVPFAFAGDQMQALSPTGFRWEAVKANFTEKFIWELDPTARDRQADLNYRELVFNYRSTAPIVRFGNHTQAVRAALFDLPTLQPQRPWGADAPARPVLWYRSNDGTFWQKFDEDPSRWIIIVPCIDGEEGNYVRNDTVLRERVPVENGVPRNVLSAARAKGCEYANVLVYGFGAAAPSNVVEVLSADARDSQSPGAILAEDYAQTLPLQYFASRLYVAVSRAKRQLVIVDSEQGMLRLWQFARDEGALRSLLAHIKRGNQVWGPLIGGMVRGEPRDLEGGEVSDPIENARAFEMDGLARKDGFLLAQAANIYKAVGNLPKWRECRAHAHEAAGDYLEAGQTFLEAGLAVPDALRCLWLAGESGWRVLRDATSMHPQLRSELEHDWAIAATQTVLAPALIARLNRLQDRVQTDAAFASRARGDAMWSRALELLVARLFGDAQDASGVRREIAPSDAVLLLDCLDALAASGLSLPNRWMGEVCHAAGQSVRAIAYWEQSGETKSLRYFEARAKATGYPAQLQWLDKLGDTDGMLRAFDAHAAPAEGTAPALNVEQTQMMVRALRAAGREADAIGVLAHARASSELFALALDLLRKSRPNEAWVATASAVHAAVRAEDWAALKELCANADLAPTKDWREKAVRTWARGRANELRAMVVRTLARHTPRRQNDAGLAVVSSFMRDWLRVTSRSRWVGLVSVAEAGAAFERSGHITDAVSFYEALLNSTDAADVALARERYLIVKYRQIELERSQRADRRVHELEQAVNARADLLGLGQRWHAIQEKGLGAEDNYPALPRLLLPHLRGRKLDQSDKGIALSDTAAKASPASAAAVKSSEAETPPNTSPSPVGGPTADADLPDSPVSEATESVSPSPDRTPPDLSSDTQEALGVIAPTIVVDANVASAAMVLPPSSAPTPAATPSAVLAMTEAPAVTTCMLGTLRVDISRPLGRCNITHTLTQDIASVRWADRRVRGDLDFATIDDSRWFCAEWDLEVFIPPSTDASTAAVQLTLRSAKLRLELIR